MRIKKTNTVFLPYLWRVAEREGRPRAAIEDYGNYGGNIISNSHDNYFFFFHHAFPAHFNHPLNSTKIEKRKQGRAISRMIHSRWHSTRTRILFPQNSSPHAETTVTTLHLAQSGTYRTAPPSFRFIPIGKVHDDMVHALAHHIPLGVLTDHIHIRLKWLEGDAGLRSGWITDLE